MRHVGRLFGLREGIAGSIVTGKPPRRQKSHPGDPTRQPARSGWGDSNAVEAYLRKTDVYFGTVDDVVDGLNSDNTVNRSTNYLFNTPFYPSGTTQFRESLAVIANEVYPRVRRVPDALTLRTDAPGS